MSDNAPQVSKQPDLAEIAWAAWWEAPTHDGTETRFMSRDAVLIMGRDQACDIRIGADPTVDHRVPRRWAELSYHRGSVLVKNIHERWGLNLVGDEESDFEVTPVPPKVAASAASSAFVLEARVPADPQDGGEGPAEFRINLSAAPTPVEPRIVPAGEDAEKDVVTTEVVSLTDKERIIAGHIVRLAQNRAHRASYETLAHRTNYGKTAVRQSVHAMDVKFVGARLAFPGDGDALDRVTYVLGRHRLDR